MLVHDFLEYSAQQFPEKTALVCEGDRWSFGRLKSACDRVSRQLWASGVRRGDRVVVLLPNSIEAVVAVFAILKAGGVFVLLNPSTKPAKVRHLLADSGAACFITSSARMKSLSRLFGETPALHSVFLDHGPLDEGVIGDKAVMEMDFGEADDDSDVVDGSRVRCIDTDLAALIYTSGSSGEPKGVALTHLNMVCAVESITTYLENTPDDVILNVLPLSFDYGLYQVLMAVKVGATVVLDSSFAYPGRVLAQIRDEGVTGFPVVPTLLAILLHFDMNPAGLSSLRYITSTGAVLPVSHIKKLRKLVPEVKIFSMYGLTECKRVSYLPPEDIDRKPASVGIAIPNLEAFVVDSEGRPVGPDTVGELVVRGPTVMGGYWGDEERTAEVLRPWKLPGEKVLYTGDLFRSDSEGYLYFVERMDDMLKSRGEKVSPREVEGVLCSLEGVLEAAVVGVEDPMLGQSIKAVVHVAPEAELDERAIQRHCAQHLENFMVPQHVELRSDFPRTSSGKIDRRVLAGE